MDNRTVIVVRALEWSGPWKDPALCRLIMDSPPSFPAQKPLQRECLLLPAPLTLPCL